MWLPELYIKFGRGLLVTLLLFFATHLFFEGALRLGVDPNAGSLQKTLILIGVLALEAALVLLVISRIGRIDIRRLLFGKLPSSMSSPLEFSEDKYYLDEVPPIFMEVL